MLTLIDSVIRKEEERELIIIEDCVNGAIQGLKEYIKRAKREWLQYTVTAITIEQQKSKNLENKNGKKNNYMDTQSEELRTLLMIWSQLG